MNGDEAMIAAVRGKKVRRAHWPREIYRYWKDDHLCAHFQEDHVLKEIRVSTEMVGNNWEIFEEPEPERSTDMEKMGLVEAVGMARTAPGSSLIELNGCEAFWSTTKGALYWTGREDRVTVTRHTLHGWRRVQAELEPEWLDSKQAEAALKAGKRVQAKGCDSQYRFMRNGMAWVHDEATGAEWACGLVPGCLFRIIGEEPPPGPVQPDVPEGYEAWEVELLSGALALAEGRTFFGGWRYLSAAVDDPRFKGYYGYAGSNGTRWFREDRALRDKGNDKVWQLATHFPRLDRYEIIVPRWVLMRTEGKTDGQK